MIDHQAIQLAIRARLLTLDVCSTGSISLAATTTGYTRTTGSFVTDGFAVGQEVTPTGFASVPRSTITSVDTLTLGVSDARTAETAASGRELAVLLPLNRAWENISFTPAIGKPYVEEQYIPGPMDLSSFGANGNLTAEPQYNLKVFVPSNVGISADGKYADALLTLFCPSTTLTLSSGDKVFVRADVGPFRGQRTQVIDGWSCVPVTIPFRIYTSNAI